MNDIDDLGLDTPAAAAATAAVAAISNAQAAAAATTAETPAAEAPKPTTPKGKFKTVYINGIRIKAKTNPGTPSEVESVAQFGVYRGNPRIIIRLNDPNEDSESRDLDYGRVQAAMDYTTFEVFLNYVEKAIASTEKCVFPIDNLSSYKGAQRFDTPQVVNTTLVGRTEDGRIWFSVRDGNRLAPKFVFGPGEYHHLRDAVTKAAVGEAQASQMYAQAAANTLRRLMPAICARFLTGEENEENLAAMDVKPASGEDRPQGGGQRQGGGGWQGNRQGGGGGGQWGNRSGGGGGGGGQWGGRQGGGGGGGFNRGGGGGGGFNRGGGGGYGGGGGGGYNRGGGNGGGYGGGQRQGGAPAAPAPTSIADDDLSF